ncbi:hypothetical protein B0H14DRAFT_3034190 [Mycena olivaceomarginata]|nr:hypothetical protein B0H14DRAFT_3034190 [Mycena olivaceomarginata]
MYASASDRTSIGMLHGGSLSTPAQMRDASGSGIPWRQPPTKIVQPTNVARTPSTGSNPYSGRLGNTLHDKRGNLTAQRNVITHSTERSGPPPAKRARMENNGSVKSRKKVSQPMFESSRPRVRRGDPDNTDAIVLDADEYEEDTGQRVYPVVEIDADDDLNITSVPSGSGSSRRNSRPVADGPSTALLRREHQEVRLAPEESDDSIESWEPVRASPPVEKGNTKTKVNRYEKLDAAATESHPYLDLATMGSQKPGVKKAMKPKNPLGAVPAENAQKPKPIPAAKPSKTTTVLPIKAWYLGRKCFDEPYHLVWTPNAKMTIRSGDNLGAPAKHTEEIDIGIVAERVLFVIPEDPVDDKKFPKKKVGNQKPIGTQYSSYFKQGGSHGEGDIVIKFDSASPAWADAVYERFIGWVKGNVQERERLTGKAGQSKWEGARRSAELLETRTKRESAAGSSGFPRPTRAKGPAVAGIPPLDTWSPPASLAVPNTTKLTSRSRREGSPSTPIEVGSPTRIPRPLSRPADSDTAGGGPRRSARRSVAPQRDPEELILVYPPGQTGAVNITNGDLARLAPGEFLNDTLIEFGLKLWLQDLEKENPELVKQIHVFSSFFYKKLDNKDAKGKGRSPEKGYESVRKWTAKFDLFDKKYIIVPINENLHWYLAIIYQPEHTLKPPLPAPIRQTKSPSTRRKTRLEAEQSPEIDQVPVSHSTKPRAPDSKASSVTRRTPSPVATAVSEGGGSGTLSPNSNMQAEAEVVDQLEPAACDTDGDANSLFDGTDVNSLFDDCMDVDGDEDVQVVETAGAAEESPPPPADSEAPLPDGGSHTASEEPAGPEVMDVDPDFDPDESMDPLLIVDPDPDPEPPAAPAALDSVKTTAFYGSAKSRGKRKAESPPLETFPPSQEASPSEAGEDEAEDGQPATCVIILDSLGGRHTRVLNVLGQYLQLEAREKKGIPLEESRKSFGKQAQVPHQPNFCDCGIYLLHLAQTFMSDPDHYYKLINKRKGSTSSSSERQIEWRDDRTKLLRQSLTERIEELSLEWQKDRAEKELKKTLEESVPESSDDDIDIVDTTPAPAHTVPPKQRKQMGKAMLGKAMRMRG